MSEASCGEHKPSERVEWAQSHRTREAWDRLVGLTAEDPLEAAEIAVGAGSYGLRSRLTLAEPEPASPSYTATPFTSQSVQLRVASADVDFGPGQCEPCVVGLQ